MEDEVKNVLATIFNLVINFWDANPMIRDLWKATELHEEHGHYIWPSSISTYTVPDDG
jgi:hypothetical protein